MDLKTEPCCNLSLPSRAGETPSKAAGLSSPPIAHTRPKSVSADLNGNALPVLVLALVELRTVVGLERSILLVSKDIQGLDRRPSLDLLIAQYTVHPGRAVLLKVALRSKDSGDILEKSCTKAFRALSRSLSTQTAILARHPKACKGLLAARSCMSESELKGFLSDAIVACQLSWAEPCVYNLTAAPPKCFDIVFGLRRCVSGAFGWIEALLTSRICW